MARPDDRAADRARGMARQLAVEAIDASAVAPVARLALGVLAALRSLGQIRPGPRHIERARVTIIDTTAREVESERVRR